MVFFVAHQGGWDQFLLFAVPVAIGVWALRFAEKKSRRAAEAESRTSRESLEKESDDGSSAE